MPLTGPQGGGPWLQAPGCRQAAGRVGPAPRSPPDASACRCNVQAGRGVRSGARPRGHGDGLGLHPGSPASSTNKRRLRDNEPTREQVPTRGGGRGGHSPWPRPCAGRAGGCPRPAWGAAALQRWPRLRAGSLCGAVSPMPKRTFPARLPGQDLEYFHRFLRARAGARPSVLGARGRGGHLTGELGKARSGSVQATGLKGGLSGSLVKGGPAPQRRTGELLGPPSREVPLPGTRGALPAVDTPEATSCPELHGLGPGASQRSAACRPAAATGPERMQTASISGSRL